MIVTSLVLALATALAAAGPESVAVAPGEELTVTAAGEGRPAVLIPGLSGCAYGFRQLTPLLQDQGYRTVVIEPLGIGLSSRPRDADYTLTAQAARLARVLDELDLRDALVIAHGVGFSMALRLALARPDQVRAIVSVEGGPAESAATPSVKTGLKFAKLIAKLAGTKFIRDRYESDLRKASGDDAWIDGRTIREYFRGPNRDLDGTLNAFIAMAEQAEPEAITPHLPEITQPVLVLQGSAEHVGALDPEEITALRGGLPNVRFQTIPGAGHFIFEEQPQAVAKAIADFDPAQAP
jgi:pimeloyl-ACP methyl ester carboxylesterase